MQDKPDWPMQPACRPVFAAVLLQMEADTLTQREAALAASQATQQAELDRLLGKQEERLRAWESGCADMEEKMEQRRKELASEEERCGM